MHFPRDALHLGLELIEEKLAALAPRPQDAEQALMSMAAQQLLEQPAYGERPHPPPPRSNTARLRPPKIVTTR